MTPHAHGDAVRTIWKLIMKALCWRGTHDVQVEDVSDPQILNPRDTIIRVTSTAICGSQPGGIDISSAEGKESTSNWSPSWLTILNDNAAERNNETADRGT